MLLRKDSFTVEPASLKFLLEHGFDFNTHYAKAIPYLMPKSEVKIRAAFRAVIRFLHVRVRT